MNVTNRQIIKNFCPKKTQQSSGQRSNRPWNEANVKQGVSYASIASPQEDDLAASIHNPGNTSQSSQTQQQQQTRRPKTNSAFETAVLDQLETMNNNFNKIFKRMEAFEARLNAIDEFLEDQFQLDPDGGLTEDDTLARNKDIGINQPAFSSDDVATSSDSHYGRRTMPHIPVSSNPAKRSPNEAEFSSPEDSPAFKFLRSQLEQQKKVAEHVLSENTALREEYKSLKAMVQTAIPREEVGMFT
jgi:regulator of replication initiation timing